MRILLVNDRATPTAGAEISAQLLLDGLRSRGHEARCLASRAQLIPGDSYADYHCFGTESRLQVLSSTYNLSARRALIAALDDFRPDIVHVKMFLWQLSPSILRPLSGYRSIYQAVVYKPICPTGTKMLPNGEPCRSPPGTVCLRSRCLTPQSWAALMLQHRLWRRNTKAFDTMITTSSAMKERMEAEGLGPFRIVPNGCHERSPRPSLSDPPAVAYAGRLSAEKGVDTLLRAFERVLGKLREARLRIFGDGPLKSQLQDLASGLGIVDRVEFTGSLPTAEMERRLDSAWLQAVPSRWQEPFGMVAIEAMMRGTTVVASDGGGLRDIVRDHQTGLLIPAGDVEAWAAALIGLLDDRARCETMGAIGRQVALEEYSGDRQVERILSIYEELVNQEPSS